MLMPRFPNGEFEKERSLQAVENVSAGSRVRGTGHSIGILCQTHLICK